MSDTFDPYREWMGIADPQRPPNHYALLGLDPFEGDTERIWDVSMHLMARVLEHDPGPHCEHARRIFDELERARDCLSDPQRKQKYDAYLRSQQSVAATAVKKKSWGSMPGHAHESSVISRAKLDPAGSSVLSAPAIDPETGSSIARRAAPKVDQPPATRRQWDKLQSQQVAAVFGALMVIGIAAYFLLREPPEHNPVPALVRDLQNPQPQERIKAARALRKLGLRASDALPPLVAALEQESNEDVRMALVEAIRETGPGVLSYSQQFEAIKARETHPGVLQILDELAFP